MNYFKQLKLHNVTGNFLITIIILSSLVNGGFGQQLVEGVAAIIGKEIVLKSEVNQMVQSYAIQNRINLSQKPKLLKEIQKKIFDRLLEQKILLVKAVEDTIVVEDHEIDQRVEQHINYMIEQVGSEEKLEEAFKSPIKKIKRDLRKETEERIKVDNLRRNKFSNVKVSRREVEKFYKTYKDSLGEIKETVDISHILKQIKPSEESNNEAREKLHNILNLLNDGGDFSELAKKYSEDPGSAGQGGDLGFTKRGDFVKEFEEVAFTLEEGEISNIVKSQFGYHIIKLIEKRGEKRRTRHILILVQPTGVDEKFASDKLNKIRDDILAGASFEEMAANNSDDENVYKDNGKLGVFEMESLKIPEFVKIVANLQPGEISEPFRTSYGFHIVKLNSRSDKRKLSLQADWERIQAMALNIKVDKEYKKWIDKLKKEIPIETRNQYN